MRAGDETLEGAGGQYLNWIPAVGHADLSEGTMQLKEISMADWTLDNIPLHAIDPALVANDEALFYQITAASFIEIAAELYTENLAVYFEGDDEVVAWLKRNWEHEEVRHGKSLRDYVRHVWPEFDWQRSYDAFYADYSQQCTVEEFEETRGLEMVARCVVEMGTATYYQSLAAQTREPILAGIAARIRADEVGHYKHFFRYFKKYRSLETPGRLRVMGALRRRLLEARRGDAECAVWHAYAEREPNGDKARYRALCEDLGRRIRSHYPMHMAVKMLLQPLELPTPLTRAVQTPLAWATSSFLLR
jgi:hypothetical protein